MDERCHLIADARPAELSEVGQILADLHGSESERLGELVAGDGRDAIGLERFELAQIQAEPSDHWVGHLGRKIHLSVSLSELEFANKLILIGTPARVRIQAVRLDEDRSISQVWSPSGGSVEYRNHSRRHVHL